ncbi:MAG: hypothetical protein OSA97_21080, partial [Nevskia sp.]|nr:hypothetical protein [Nevskia sp.]
MAKPDLLVPARYYARLGEVLARQRVDLAAALRAVADALAAEGAALDRLALVAHRVVHGGDEFTAPARITDKVRAGIE